MSYKYKQKIAICYSCSGESYRESALRRLTEDYFDDDNLYYFIITDDKNYFKAVNRKNLIVNELKDFYDDFPMLEKYEALIDSKDKNDYAKKFIETRYLYSFSLLRFHLLQAARHGISNINLMCTDTCINFNTLNIRQEVLNTNTIYNAVSEWDSYTSNPHISMIANILEEKYGYVTQDPVRVLDAAGRFFCLDSVDTCKKLFEVWNEVIVHLYEKDMMKHYAGSYVYNDEYILAPIYQMFGLNKMISHSGSSFFIVNHNALHERFWRLGRSGIVDHTNYEEFLKINNITKNG